MTNRKLSKPDSQKIILIFGTDQRFLTFTSEEVNEFAYAAAPTPAGIRMPPQKLPLHNYYVKGVWFRSYNPTKGYFNPMWFTFNDPKIDFLGTKNGVIKQLRIVTKEFMDGIMQTSGIAEFREFGEGADGWVDMYEIFTSSARKRYLEDGGVALTSYEYAYKNGLAGKNLDFSVKQHLYTDTFYTIDSVAYNVADFGNYLFGRSMAELGIDRPTAQIGAHYNNFFYAFRGGKDKLDKHNLGADTYGDPSPLDSEADQRAIRMGHKSVALKTFIDHRNPNKKPVSPVQK